MPKKKSRKQLPKDGKIKKIKDPDANSEEYIYNEVDQFHRSKDKILLDPNDEQPSDDEEVQSEEEEVMGIAGQSSDEEEDEDDDLDEKELDETDLINDKAWGKNKKAFYDADVQDEDVYASDEEAAAAAAEEEKEAMSIQQRMAKHLDEQDFYAVDEGEEVDKESDESEGEEENVKTDYSKLSKREKLEILSKQSPELLPLIEECKERLKELNDIYHPLLLMSRKGLIPSKEGKTFIETKHKLLANYCVNITFYLSMKAGRESMKGHPIYDTLIQHKELLSQLDEMEEGLEAQIEILLSRYQSGEWKSMQSEQQPPEEAVVKKISRASKPKKKKKIENGIDPMEYYKSIKEETEKRKELKANPHKNSDEEEEEIEEEELDEEGKRKITYEMSKNKGLIRKRRKELKNPRVKHKMKFKKAKIKHKGQVQEVRREMERYGGETTGIKASLSKSTKIK